MQTRIFFLSLLGVTTSPTHGATASASTASANLSAYSQFNMAAAAAAQLQQPSLTAAAAAAQLQQPSLTAAAAAAQLQQPAYSNAGSGASFGAFSPFSSSTYASGAERQAATR